MINVLQFPKVLAELSPGYAAYGKDLLIDSLVSFSLSGEDIVINRLLHNQDDRGLFVDIGSYHPVRFSNTFLLYLRGWRGINVDANLDVLDLFNKVRPLDTNIHLAINTTNESKFLIKYQEPAYNHLSDSSTPPQNGPSKVIGVEKVECRKINDFLSEYVGDKKFDFLNIDIEGLDLAVLETLDFSRFRPSIIALELGLSEVVAEPFQKFLKEIGYTFHSFCSTSAIIVKPSRTHF